MEPQLEAGDIAVVRTGHLLNDAQFCEIGTELIERIGNQDMGGCYWMGVIVVVDDASLLE